MESQRVDGESPATTWWTANISEPVHDHVWVPITNGAKWFYDNVIQKVIDAVSWVFTSILNFVWPSRITGEDKQAVEKEGVRFERVAGAKWHEGWQKTVRALGPYKNLWFLLNNEADESEELDGNAIEAAYIKLKKAPKGKLNDAIIQVATEKQLFEEDFGSEREVCIKAFTSDVTFAEHLTLAITRVVEKKEKE